MSPPRHPPILRTGSSDCPFVMLVSRFWVHCLGSLQLLTGGGSEASKIEGENAEKDGRPTKKSDAKAGEGDKKELQEEEKEMRTIFVGNLPITFNPKKVKGRFKEYGAIESVRLRSVAVEGMAVDKAGDQVSLSPPCLPLPSFRRSIVCILFCACVLVCWFFARVFFVCLIVCFLSWIQVVALSGRSGCHWWRLRRGRWIRPAVLSPDSLFPPSRLRCSFFVSFSGGLKQY